MSKTKNIILSVILAIIFLAMYLPVLCIKNSITELINIFSIIIFCPLFILLFSNVLDSNNLKDWEYNGIHIIYAFLPFGLMVQYSFIEEKWKYFLSFLITIIISLINTYILYKKVKKIKMHLKKLKYSNLLLTTIFTIIFAAIKLYKDIPETILFLFCISPLLILQLAYEKMDSEN